MYNMTALALTLNELPADPSTLPRTDCRLRPDLRALETCMHVAWGRMCTPESRAVCF